MRNSKTTDDRKSVLGDPIIRELRAIRAERAASCGYDLDEMFRQLRARHRALEREQGRLSPRRVSPTGPSAG